MTALPRIVLGYTTNLTTLEVAVVLELGRWSWSIMPKLGVRLGPWLLRPFMVLAATVVRSTMGRRANRGNQGSSRSGGGRC